MAAVAAAAVVRSVLCVPGHNARKVQRCRDFGADLILFDLEDAVPEKDKETALRLIQENARSGDAVRVDGPWRLRDLEGVVDTVWMPKVKSRDDVPRHLWSGTMWALVECPRGVGNAREIAEVSSGLAFGRWDFMAATGIADPWSPLVEHAMGQISLAAHASGIACSDAPCYVLDGGDEMRAEVRRAKGYGFASKGCVHPNQIPYCAGLAHELGELRGVDDVDTEGVSRNGGFLAGPPMQRLAERLRIEVKA